jgi:lysophospholipase L1-like esterase
MSGPFTPETYQSGDGNLNEPITVGRLGQPVRIGGGTEWQNIGSGPIADRPIAADFGPGTWQDGDNIYTSDGNAWSGGNATQTSVIDNFNVSTWGDSLTFGAYPKFLAQKLGTFVFNGGVLGETSTAIKNRMLAATDKYNTPTVIWAGRNNIVPATIKSDIAEMVAVLTGPYIILGVTNSATEILGSPTLNTIKQLNTDLSALYGDHFIDIRSYIVSQYDPALPQDVIDFSNDIMPLSLRMDDVHLNDSGYNLVATQVYNKLLTMITVNNEILTVNSFRQILKQYFTTGEYYQTNLSHNTSGYGNTGTGYGALFFNTIGVNNTAYGYSSLYLNVDGYSNTAVGTNSLHNSTGYNNTGVGTLSLYLNREGYNNTGTGNVVLFSNTTGHDNTGTGHGALYATTTGNYNTGSGVNSLRSNTTGSYNAADGYSSLYSNTTGTFNTAGGNNSMYFNTVGSHNTSFGFEALKGNVSGNYNCGVGDGALKDAGLTTISTNIVAGVAYTIAAVGTTNFTLIGASANTVGVAFTATGAGSGTGTATPNNINYNTSLGYASGQGIIYGVNNTILGARVTGLPAGLSNNIILASGDGAIKAQWDGSAWNLAGFINETSKEVDATASLTAKTITTRNTYLTGSAGASFAVTLPPAAVSIDGQKIVIMSVSARTTTTWISTGATGGFIGLPATLAANTPYMMQYDHASLAWYITL